MGDLQNLLYARHRNRKGYWGNFAFLNTKDPNYPNISAIHNLQQQRILFHETKQGTYDRINKYFDSGVQSSIGRAIEDKVFEEVSQKVAYIFSGANKDFIENQSQGFYKLATANDLKTFSGTKEEKQTFRDARYPIKENIEKACLEIEQIFKKHYGNNDEMIKVSDSMIKYLKQLSLEDQASIKAISNEKGKLFEEMVKAYLTSNSSVTGKVMYNANFLEKIAENSIKSGQMVQDMILYSPSQGGTSLSVKLTFKDGASKEETLTLDELQSLINKEEVTVSLKDDSSELFDKINALKIQVKSGLNQSIVANRFKTPFISLEDLGAYERGSGLLRPLAYLYKEDPQGNPGESNRPWFKKIGGYSDTLKWVALELLSQRENIYEQIIGRNDVYATANGFLTASEWYNKHPNAIMTFTPAIRKIRSYQDFTLKRGIVMSGLGKYSNLV